MLIDKSLLEIEKLLPFFKKTNVKVSAVNVGWHLDHSLKVVNNVCLAIKQSKIENYKSNFSFLKSYILLIGIIPRGKAKAPKNVISTADIFENDILEQLISARINLDEVKKMPAKSHFQHPYFGMLCLKESLRFLAIHTNHHLKIAQDIIKN